MGTDTTAAVNGTQLSASRLVDSSGALRQAVRYLNATTDQVHKNVTFREWTERTAVRGREAPARLLDEIAELGFSWRGVARMLGVSVPAVQKWRRGERLTGEHRRELAGLLAACDFIAEHYVISEIASWFEMPLLFQVPISPAYLYAADRPDLVFDYASGHTDPTAVLDEFEPDWSQRYRSDFEVFTAQDGFRSLRSVGE